MDNREYETERLKKMLINHDWFYEYSDDHSVWRRGNEKERELMSIAQKDKRAEVLFEGYRSYMFKGAEKPDAP